MSGGGRLVLSNGGRWEDDLNNSWEMGGMTVGSWGRYVGLMGGGI